jgi:hypothetical protein
MALDLKWSTLYYQLQFEGRINSALPNTVWDLDALLKCQFFERSQCREIVCICTEVASSCHEFAYRYCKLLTAEIKLIYSAAKFLAFVLKLCCCYESCLPLL